MVMLEIPKNKDEMVQWTKELVDDCMASADERGMIYAKAAEYFYRGSATSEAAIHNKAGGFVDKLAGYLYQPHDIRFNIVFESHETDTSVLSRAEAAGTLLSREYRLRDADLAFGDTVTWSLVCGCYLLKHMPAGAVSSQFRVWPVHPQNFGVLSENIISLEEQEAFVHVTYPSVTQLRKELDGYPDADKIIEQVMSDAGRDRDEKEPIYFHQMIVGGLHPLGTQDGANPQAAGVVNVFPTPKPWRPERQSRRTLKLCEVWVRDKDRDGDYTTIKFLYPDITIEGYLQRRNLSKVPGRSPFVKVQPEPTPGYFWGRSSIADIQMLQDVYNKRLRDIKVLWDRNTAAPQVFTGFTSVSEEEYYKIISEGGFIQDPNPQAKAQKLVDPPPEHYLEELQMISQLFDEAAGFTPILSGQGEQGVRAGVHAQTLVRTSSPRLIDRAARIERQLADSGYLCFKILQAQDPTVQVAESGDSFMLSQIPEGFQVEVDSHSASPAFAEDIRQTAIALAQAQAIDAEDLLRLLHPPGLDLLISRLRERQAAMARERQAAEARGEVTAIKPPGRQHARQGRQ